MIHLVYQNIIYVNLIICGRLHTSSHKLIISRRLYPNKNWDKALMHF